MFKQLSRHCSRTWIYGWVPLFFLLGVLLGRTQNIPAWADASLPTPGVLSSADVTNSEIWAAPPEYVGTSQNPVSPQIVVSPSGVVHLVWEDAGRIYHAWRDAQGEWRGPYGLYYGYTPAIALDSKDRLHLVYSANPARNFEIYHVVFENGTWGLPRNVSHTQGASYSPQIAVAPDGSLHVVWNDNTPGEEVLYQAVLDDAIWINAPLMGAWGKAPSIQIDNSLIMHVLWQGYNKDNKTDVFYMAGKGGMWTVPRNLSDSSYASVGGQSVIDYAGQVHAVWTENLSPSASRALYYVRYTVGRNSSWLRPQTIAQADSEDANIATSERGSYVHVWWFRGGQWWEQWRGVGAERWSAPTPLTRPTSNEVLFRFANRNDSRLRAFWQVDSPEGAEIYYGEVRTPVKQVLYFPRMGHNAAHNQVTSP